jgi:hypothetical protein
MNITKLFTLAITLLLTGKAALAADAYSTVEAAAKDGLAAAEALTDRFEAGLGIYQCGAAYAYLPPTTDGKKDRVSIRIMGSSECRLAAVAHTHPKGDTRFSPADIKAACTLKVPSYIKPRGGSIRVFDCSTLSPAAVKVALTRPITGTEI